MTENTTTNKGGRPKVELDAQQIRDVELLAAFLPIAEIADYLGISEKTFRNLKKRDEKVLTAYTRGAAKAQARVGNILMKFMQYDGKDTAQLNLKFQAAKFYAQTKAGWGRDDAKVRFNIPDNTSPVDITNIVIAEIRDGNITLPKVKQLIELAQARQKLTSLQPQDADSANKPSLEECLEIANKLLPTANILELQRENRELKKKLETFANA